MQCLDNILFNEGVNKRTNYFYNSESRGAITRYINLYTKKIKSDKSFNGKELISSLNDADNHIKKEVNKLLSKKSKNQKIKSSTFKGKYVLLFLKLNNDQTEVYLLKAVAIENDKYGRSRLINIPFKNYLKI